MEYLRTTFLEQFAFVRAIPTEMSVLQMRNLPGISGKRQPLSLPGVYYIMRVWMSNVAGKTENQIIILQVRILSIRKESAGRDSSFYHIFLVARGLNAVS